MQNLQTLLMILTPMFIGFAIRLPKPLLRILDRCLNGLVYLILLLIGISLAQESGIVRQIDNIAVYVAVLFGLLMLCNTAMLAAFDRLRPWQRPLPPAEKKSGKTAIFGGLLQLVWVLAGCLLGLLLPKPLLPPHDAGTYALMLLMFAVGIQLRGSGIGLRQVLLNRRGLEISAVFMLSCLLAGALFSLLFHDVPLAKGLALSSGYGWYSLSGIMMTQSYGAMWGSVALLNDLLREFFALVCIPLLMRRHPSAAVGIGGATSMDFTLPVIRQAGGLAVVPLAVCFGFIVNLAAPVLMMLFAAWR